MKKRIVIFASGNGTNAENIIRYFQLSTIAEIVLVMSNNKNAKVLERSQKLKINTLSFTKPDLLSEEGVIKILQEAQPDLIVLAGFLLKMPEFILKEFPNRVINIHPALLPKYGGKGMYGSFVHESVVANGESETGITIHYVNENYDEGSIIFQEKVAITEFDTPESIAAKVHELEYKYFPKVIEKLLDSKANTN